MEVQLVLPAPVLQRIRAQAAAAYPEECCGILVGKREPESIVVSRDVRCSNVAPGPDRRRRFEIHPRTLLNVVRDLRDSDEEVVGFYHSHPDSNAKLSPTDLTFVGLWPETAWLVISVGRKGAREQRAWWLPSAANRAADAPLDAALLVELPLLAEPAGAVSN